jgi:hypothetical protein
MSTVQLHPGVVPSHNVGSLQQLDSRMLPLRRQTEILQVSTAVHVPVPVPRVSTADGVRACSEAEEKSSAWRREGEPAMIKSTELACLQDRSSTILLLCVLSVRLLLIEGSLHGDGTP